MYASFFGLSQDPFSIAPDPRYLFMSERHREALAHLLYGLGGGGGFVLLTGEIGTGKTTVCRCFLEQIPADCNVAYIFNPKLTVGELLQSVCDEFGIPHGHNGPGEETAKDCIDPLNAFLLRTHAAGQHNVLIIDEAQNLSADVLEQLRLLTNLETNERKLLQIILIGQPELRTLLARPELEQLAQRVIARFHLDALSLAETEHYIAHRLAIGGRHGALPFDRAALQLVHRMTHGVPRRINLLCGRALLGAYATGQSVVDRKIVAKAGTEVFGDLPAARSAGHPKAVAAGLGLVAGVALLAGLGWAMGVKLPWTGASPTAASSAAGPHIAAARPAASQASAALAATATAAATDHFADLFTTLPRAEDAAWRALAADWKATPDAAADPCEALPAQGLQCFRSTRTSLALIRQLDRPGLLTLTDAQGRPAYALLRGLDARNATLLVNGQPRAVPLATLALYWRGEYATLWRTPPLDDRLKGEKARAAATAQWVSQQLATLPGVATPASGAAAGDSPRERIYRFQLAQGLVPDGQAGPITLMLLNRATGVAEPQLQK
ncbi:peptidoglycan-binding protein [Rhodoferax koreense]|uniref:Peptidoglycan-binding protein n=1 Tax=Rhodoferax koreensis TaxID=1842727 RepID=A0A1P8K1Q3_9BURK|nr:AAA family ATPase [Rhodoferax koreense]APW39938.1 peptidoglycan-binding protein [Rhodoferax koreense]